MVLVADTLLSADYNHSLYYFHLLSLTVSVHYVIVCYALCLNKTRQLTFDHKSFERKPIFKFFT